ncbi:hypothetical protein M9458_043985, partial [Cirrhinus mrigala]
CQIQRAFEMCSSVTVLHSSPKFSIKTHCSRAEKNVEECSMWNICDEDHIDEARTPHLTM